MEDLTAAIELYNTLIGLRRYDDAVTLYYDRLADAMFFRLSTFRQCSELLKMLFPDGLDQLPRLSKTDNQSSILNELALSIVDQPKYVAEFYLRSIEIYERVGDQLRAMVGLRNLSMVLHRSGALYESEASARLSMLITQKLGSNDGMAASLYWLGITLAARGKKTESAKALDQSLKIALLGAANRPYDLQAKRSVWFAEYANAQKWADRAMYYSQLRRRKIDMINAMVLQGEAALGLGDLSKADEHFQHALTRARTVNLVEEELPALIGLAELRRRQGDLKAARELLEDVWEPCEPLSNLFDATCSCSWQYR